MTKQDPTSARLSRSPLVPILGLALLLRLPAALIDINHHPDEIWQYLEQAYGIVFGRAVVPWEYREQIRSWLLPALLAGPLWLGSLLQPLGVGLLLPLRLSCALVSLSIVAAAYGMAGRISRRHAAIAGLVMATSFELAYFGARALSDSVAVALFMPAAWLLHKRDATARETIAAGILLGLCFCVRFQLAPAIAMLALLLLRTNWRAWRGVVIGGLLALLIDGAADVLNGGVPFRWLLRNVWQNIVVDRSSHYGVEPVQWYVVEQLRLWSWAFGLVIALAALGARRFPALCAAAIVNVAFHSLIPHKEYRFVLLSVTIVIFLAAVGSADLVDRLSGRVNRRILLVALALFWPAVGATAATSRAGKEQWKSFRRFSSLMHAAHREPGACGLALFQPGSALSAAYVFYDRATPIFVFKDGNDGKAAVDRARTFNLVITSPDRIHGLGDHYALRRCFSGHRRKRSSLPLLPDRCLYVRPGGCEAAPDHRFDINTVLREQDE